MEAEMLLTNLERMLSKVSLTIPDGCYSNMQNPKNIKNASKEYEGMYNCNQNEQTSSKSGYIFCFYLLRRCPHNEDTSANNGMTIILNQHDNTVITITVTTTKTTTTSKDNNHITF